MFFISGWLVRRRGRKVRTPEMDPKWVAERVRRARTLRNELVVKEREVEARTAEVRRLKSDLRRLETQLKEQSVQIETLRSGELTRSPEGDSRRFRQLRALLIRELHPDHASGDSVDRALREAVFKSLWPKVEAICAQ
jgi:hypothetical protein